MYGPMVFSSSEKQFWMPDFGKLKMFRFDMDSFLQMKDIFPRFQCLLGWDFF